MELNYNDYLIICSAAYASVAVTGVAAWSLVRASTTKPRRWRLMVAMSLNFVAAAWVTLVMLAMSTVAS